MFKLNEFVTYYASYLVGINNAETLYIYEMYKYNKSKFNIKDAVNDINRIRKIKLSKDCIIKELVS